MTTANELYNYALTRLNVLGDGQTATAGQTAKMERILNSFHAYLVRKGHVNYDLEDIPDEDVDPMVTLLAWRARFDFSASAERILALREEVGRASQILLANNQVEYDGEPVEALYY